MIFQKKYFNLFLKIGLLAVILLLWFHMHIYKLGEIPFEMHIDEYGIGYDSYCLLNYGVDRWLMNYPVYLNNYGSGSSAAYSVLCAICILITGNTSTFTLRLPAALVSFLSMLLVMMITREFDKKYLPFLAALMFNILPYFTMQSRIALDCNLMMFGMLAVVFFNHKALVKGKKWFYLAGIVTGLSLYTYILSWIVVPVFLFIYLIYAIYLKKISMKNLAAFGISCGILAWPLILCAVVNLFSLDTINLGIITIPHILDSRSNEIVFSNLFEALICFFKTVFWGDNLPANSVYGFFTFYKISVPIICLGIIIAFIKMIIVLKNKECNILVLINALFIAELVLAVAIGSSDELIGSAGININRINGVMGILLIYLMYGIYCVSKGFGWFFDRMFSGRFKCIKIIPVVIITIIYIPCFLKWEKYYMNDRTPAQFAFAAPLDEVVDFFGDGIFTKNVHLDANYAQFLLATHVSPYEFNAPVLERDYSNMKSWRNIKFNLWGEFGVVDDDAIYIVYKEHKEYIEYFSMFDFNIFETNRYICFYN